MAFRNSATRNRKPDVLAAACPSRGVLDHVASRWGVLVLFSLREETLRFGELREKVGGVSEKMLAQTLSTLERDGLVRREAHAVIPPRVDYSLTTLGRALAERVEHLVDFVETNLTVITQAQSKYDRRKRGET